MKNIVVLLLKASVVATLIFGPIFALAQSPFSQPTTERIRIDFFRIPEWIEITKKEEIPENIAINIVDDEQMKIHVADFIQDGEAIPDLMSVFKNNVNSHPTLFLIIKWHYYLPVANTEGDYYEVHAYGATSGAGNGVASLTENKRLSEHFGSGFEGKKEGSVVHFRFKDAASVRHDLLLIEPSRDQTP